MKDQRTNTGARGWTGIGELLRGSRALLFAGIFFGLLDAVCQACIPLFFRAVLNSVQTDVGAFMAGGFRRLSGLGFLLLLVFPLSAYLFHLLVNLGVMHFCRNLQVAIYRHVQRLSMDFFQRFRVGEITARLNTDVEVVGNGASFIMSLAWAPALLATSLAMMFWINTGLALICLGMLSFVALATYLVLPWIRSWHRDLRDAVGDVSATITEYLSLTTLLKAYVGEDFAETRVSGKSDDLLARRVRVARRQYAFTDAMQTLTRLVAPLTLLFLGAARIARGQLMAGDLAAFWGYWLQLSGVVQGLVSTFSGAMGSVTALDRIFVFFREQPAVRDPEKPLPLAGVRGELEFRDVSFRYPMAGPAGQAVLRHLDLRAAAGEHLALVGPSGAGKSTALALIMRFHDPDAGEILLDGRPITLYAQKDLRAQIGLLLQESMFFAGSVEENLRLAAPRAARDQLWAALTSAQAADFVKNMPEGLETPLGERGARLSGGEKQRLAIARLFLKDPRIILFDEPTSALDAESESHVKEAIARLFQDRTTITIAHRLSTILDADRIVVMAGGSVVSEGRHEYLRSSCPLYGQLCARQGL